MAKSRLRVACRGGPWLPPAWWWQQTHGTFLGLLQDFCVGKSRHKTTELKGWRKKNAFFFFLPRWLLRNVGCLHYLPWAGSFNRTISTQVRKRIHIPTPVIFQLTLWVYTSIDWFKQMDKLIQFYFFSGIHSCQLGPDWVISCSGRINIDLSTFISDEEFAGDFRKTILYATRNHTEQFQVFLQLQILVQKCMNDN